MRAKEIFASRGEAKMRSVFAGICEIYRAGRRYDAISGPMARSMSYYNDHLFSMKRERPRHLSPAA